MSECYHPYGGICHLCDNTQANPKPLPDCIDVSKLQAEIAKLRTGLERIRDHEHCEIKPVPIGAWNSKAVLAWLIETLHATGLQEAAAIAEETLGGK